MANVLQLNEVADFTSKLNLENEIMNTEKTSIENENEPSCLGTVSTRYFFVCTMGKNPNGTIGFSNFDIQTTYGHPTFKRCIELSNEKFPNMYEVTLISISEISAEDWKVFVSEQ